MPPVGLAVIAVWVGHLARYVIGCRSVMLAVCLLGAAGLSCGVGKAGPQGPHECAIDVVASSGTRYFVDSSAANAHDDNSGTSAEAPLASLAGLRRKSLGPGDVVAVKAGSHYAGELDLAAKGTAAAPILITSYGEGVEPSINAVGPHGIRLTGASHVILEKLEIRGATEAAVLIDDSS